MGHLFSAGPFSPPLPSAFPSPFRPRRSHPRRPAPWHVRRTCHGKASTRPRTSPPLSLSSASLLPWDLAPAPLQAGSCQARDAELALSPVPLKMAKSTLPFVLLLSPFSLPGLANLPPLERSVSDRALARETVPESLLLEANRSPLNSIVPPHLFGLVVRCRRSWTLDADSGRPLPPLPWPEAEMITSRAINHSSRRTSFPR